MGTKLTYDFGLLLNVVFDHFLHYRIYGLSASIKTVATQAHLLNKRMVGVLENDRLTFSLQVRKKWLCRVLKLSCSQIRYAYT